MDGRDGTDALKTRWATSYNIHEPLDRGETDAKQVRDTHQTGARMMAFNSIFIGEHFVVYEMNAKGIGHKENCRLRVCSGSRSGDVSPLAVYCFFVALNPFSSRAMVVDCASEAIGTRHVSA